MTEEINLPIWQEDQARQSKQSLLARPIYSKIAHLVRLHLERIGRRDGVAVPLEEVRAHDAILVSGSRGTGKSSILVNLKTFLHDEPEKKTLLQGPKLGDRLLILRPVDPTLLDSADDLLLNVIVAAVIRNEEVSHRLGTDDIRTQQFYERLHRLGAALESVQTRSSKYGIDRLRSFMGNHGLAGEIHKFFHETLKLTDRDLIVLPIDDVDTSLHHAFENLEIVRKYLATPYVLPIISGDIRLYHEVIWREMHSRIVRDSRAERLFAITQAKALAQEYEIKVMPLSRRLVMPGIEEYLRNPNIFLTNAASSDSRIDRLMSLPSYVAWIESLLNERVNGIENSHLSLPVRSLRMLTQLIFTTRDEIRPLSRLFKNVKALGPKGIRRLLFMPLNVSNEIDSFSVTLQNAETRVGASKSRQKAVAYAALQEKAQEADKKENTLRQSTLQTWAAKLTEYFKNQHDAGAAFLVLDTWQKWIREANEPLSNPPEYPDFQTKRMLHTPLFLPTLQHNFDHFEKKFEVAAEWRRSMSENQAPESWLTRLPEHAVLPYPLPELGRQMSSLGKSESSKTPNSKEVELLRLIMVHRNFYSRSERTAMVFCGRLFEIVVTSCIHDLNFEQLSEILDDHPFYSLTMMANTKTMSYDGDGEESIDYVPLFPNNRQRAHRGVFPEAVVRRLAEQIQKWRAENRMGVPHPWLFYNVMNKFYNQVSIFNARGVRNNSQGSISELIQTADKAFNALWSTIGSFEKGPIFGLDSRIAYQNIGSGNFENSTLYNLNIRPFIDMHPAMGSYTRALVTHPIRRLILDLANIRVEADGASAELSRIMRELSKEARLILSNRLADTSSRAIVEMEFETAYQAVDEIHDALFSRGLEKDWELLNSGTKYQFEGKTAVEKAIILIANVSEKRRQQ